MIVEFILRGQTLAFKEIKGKRHWSYDRIRMEVNSACEDLKKVHEKKLSGKADWQVVLTIKSRVDEILVVEKMEDRKRLFELENYCPITGFAL